MSKWDMLSAIQTEQREDAELAQLRAKAALCGELAEALRTRLNCEVIDGCENCIDTMRAALAKYDGLGGTK